MVCSEDDWATRLEFAVRGINSSMMCSEIPISSLNRGRSHVDQLVCGVFRRGVVEIEDDVSVRNQLVYGEARSRIHSSR